MNILSELLDSLTKEPTPEQKRKWWWEDFRFYCWFCPVVFSILFVFVIGICTIIDWLI